MPALGGLNSVLTLQIGMEELISDAVHLLPQQGRYGTLRYGTLTLIQLSSLATTMAAVNFLLTVY